MLRLTALLLAAMFLALMIGGEDRGQMRPGLARAALEPKAEPVAKTAVDEVVRVVAAAPVVEPASASKAAPVPVAVAAVAPEAVQPREMVQEVEEVFTLSNLATEEVPAAPEAEPSDGTIMYVTANSVNVREAPSTEASVLGKLAAGEAALMVSDVDGEWARIVIQGDGMEGYVALRFLSAVSP